MELDVFHYELPPGVLMQLVSFLFWACMYLYCSVKAPGQSPEWCSRVVTLLHGTVATLIGLSQCGLGTLSTSRLTMKVMPRHFGLMVWSWGYFAFDLMWCVLSGTESYLMLCHHVSALIAITMYMGKENSGCTFACHLAAMEITNPLLQTRWFLRAEGYANTRIYLFVEVLYVLLFTFTRGILGSWVLYKMLTEQIFDIDEKIISLVFYVVGLLFIYDIYGFIAYKHKDKVETLKNYLRGNRNNIENVKT